MSDSVFLRNEQLALCDQLKAAGFPQEYAVGTQLCRGFADLGYEQFLVLPSDRLLSLFTGDCSNLEDSHMEHFSVVPSQQALVLYLQSLGCSVRLEFDEGEWEIDISCGDFSVCSTTDAPWDALLDAAIGLSDPSDELAM